MKKDIDRLWEAINIIFEALEEMNTEKDFEISEKLDELSAVLRG